MSRKRVCFVFDGGGNRSIMSCVLAAEIERRIGRRIYEVSDIISGVSAGALVALGLSINKNYTNNNCVPPYSGEDLKNMFLISGIDIFKKSAMRDIKTGKGLFGARYSNKGLNKVCDSYFYNYKLGDSLCNTMVSAYDMTRRELVVFKSWKANHKDYKIAELGKTTTTAPTFFKPVEFNLIDEEFNEYKSCLTDSGVANNNSTLSAYAEAKKMYPNDEILIINIGTGGHSKSYKYKNVKDWGILAFGKHMVDIFIDGQAKAVEYEARVLLGDNYKQIQFDIPDDIDYLDRPKDSEKLINVAENWIIENDEYLQSICDQLIENYENR